MKALETSLHVMVVVSISKLYQHKSRLTEESKDLALFISKLQLGQYEMPFEDYFIMESKDIINVEYCMLELVDVALG